MAERDQIQADSAPRPRPGVDPFAGFDRVVGRHPDEADGPVARLEAVESILERLGGRLEAVERRAEQLSGLPDRVESRVVESEFALTERHSADLERFSDLIVAEAQRSREADRALEGALSARLAAAEQRLDSLVLSLSERLDALERDAATAAAPPDDPQGSAAEPAAAATPPEYEPGGDDPRRPPEVYPINEVTFEQLRALGCSATQAARIIARRSSLGNFDDPDALDDVPGLPAEFRAALKQQLTAG